MCDLRPTPRTLREAFPDPKDWLTGPTSDSLPLYDHPVPLARFSPQLWYSLAIYLACIAAIAVFVLALWWMP